MGARKWVHLFLSNYKLTPCLERHRYDRRSEMVHHPAGKLVPQRHDAKQCSPSQPKKCQQSPKVLQKKRGPITLIFIKAHHTLTFSNIMRVFNFPYMTIMPENFSTHMKCCLVRKTQSVKVGLNLFNAGKNFKSKWISSIRIFACYILDQLKLADVKFPSFAQNIINSSVQYA